MFEKVKIGWIACCMMLLCNLSYLSGQELRQDQRLVKGQLKNGFKYYIYPHNGNNKQTSLQLFVNAGSLQEKESQLGLAHFVEHMAFNGSKNYPKNEVVTYLESLGLKFGADLNAHTSFDETVYKITIDTKNEDNLYKALDIVYDWAFNLSFDSLEIEKERGIIIEEWRTKQGASSRMSDQTLPLIFYNSRYADRKPIGNLDILRNFDRYTIVDFYNTWYRPDLMGIAIITNQDVYKTEKIVKKLFSRIKKSKKVEDRIQYKLAEHSDTLFRVYTDKEANSVDFSYITKLPSLGPLKAQKDLEIRVLRSATNALIKKRLDRIAQLNDNYKSASMSFSDLLLHNGLSIGGAVLYENHVEEGLSKFLTEKERITRFGFTNQEIEEYKKLFSAQMSRTVDQENALNSGLLLAQLKDDFFIGNVLMDKNDRRDLTIKIMNEIDSLDLLNHIQSYFKPGNTVILLSGPDRIIEQLPTDLELRKLFYKAQQTNLLPWKDELYVPTKLLSNEPIPGNVVSKSTIDTIGLDKWVLSNGVTVYLKQSKSRKDHIQLTGFRKGGFIALDSVDYVNGLFVKNILGASGAGDFSRQALTKYLNGNSASATFMISSHREGLSASANKKDMQTMFELLYLKWTAPKVDEVVFNSVKRKSIDAARSKDYNVLRSYNDALNKAIGADNFDENSVDANRIQNELKKDEILSVFNKRFGSAKGFDFVVIGDFHKDSLQVLIEKYLGGLPSGDLVTEQQKPSYDKVEDRKILMYAGQADKATINLFFQTQDFNYNYPNIMINEIAENIIKIKLRKNLREENSGVYGVGVGISATSEPTNLIRTRISFTCEPSRKDFLVDQVYIELNKIANDDHYFSEELGNVKKQMLQTYEKQYDKDTFWSAEIRNHIYFGFPNWNYFTAYQSMLDSISAEQIRVFVKNKIIKAKNIEAVLMPEKLKN